MKSPRIDRGSKCQQSGRSSAHFFKRMAVMMVCMLCVVLLQQQSSNLRGKASILDEKSELSATATATADTVNTDVSVVQSASAADADINVSILTALSNDASNGDDNDDDAGAGNVARKGQDMTAFIKSRIESTIVVEKDEGVSYETPSNNDNHFPEVDVSLSGDNDDDEHQDIYTPSSLDIAVGVHVDVGTLIATNYLSALRASWTGKLCVVVYVKSSQKRDYDAGRWWADLPPHIQVFVYGRPGLDFFKKPVYPINALRQVLSERCHSERLIHLDAGLVFSSNPVATLDRHSEVIMQHNAQTLFVIPAFELCDDDCENPGEYGAPTNKRELAKCFHAGCCCPFKHNNNRAYGATRHSEWVELPDDKFMKIGHVLSQRYIDTYEPFVLGVRECFPRFNPTFPYGFRNKASWHLNLRALGATYTAFPDIFLVHSIEEGDRDAGPQTKLDAWKRNREILFNHMYSFRQFLLASHPKPGCFEEEHDPDILDALERSNKKAEKDRRKWKRKNKIARAIEATTTATTIPEQLPEQSELKKEVNMPMSLEV